MSDIVSIALITGLSTAAVGIVVSVLTYFAGVSSAKIQVEGYKL